MRLRRAAIRGGAEQTCDDSAFCGCKRAACLADGGIQEPTQRRPGAAKEEEGGGGVVWIDKRGAGVGPGTCQAMWPRVRKRSAGRRGRLRVLARSGAKSIITGSTRGNPAQVGMQGEFALGGAGLQPLKASSGSASDAVCHGRRRRVTESGVSAASCRDGVQNVCGRVMQLHLEEVSDVALCAATPSPYKRLMLTQDDDGGRRRGCDWEETRTAACIREGAVARSGLVASTLLGVPADPWEGRRAGASLGGWEAGRGVRMRRD